MSERSLQAQTAQEDKQTQSGYLTFSLGTEVFGINIGDITEIINVQPITTLPEVPTYIKGIINLRGRIVPVIDMRLKFHKEPEEYNDRTCVVVIEIMNLTVGLIVDKVTEVVSIDHNAIVPPPEYAGLSKQGKYISGIGRVGKDIVLLLDCYKLLEQEIKLEEFTEL